MKIHLYIYTNYNTRFSLKMSSSDLTFGAPLLLPGLSVLGPESEDDHHQLLRTLQIKDAAPPIPTSRHRKQDEIFMKGTELATHVYVKVDNPGNLAVKFLGPFPLLQGLQRLQLL